MRNKKGTLPLVANMIIGLVILGAGTMFVTSDIGQPYFNSLSNWVFPEMTPGCDTNSVDSINGLAYALNCVGMHHAGIDVTEICPAQNDSGSKIIACYGDKDNYQCEVQGFELTKSPNYEESDPEGWLTGMGDPNCLVYYEAFPEEQASDWKVRVQGFSWGGMLLGGTLNMIPGMKNPVKAGYNGLKLSLKGIIKVAKDPAWMLKSLGKLPGAVIRTPGVIYKASKSAFQKTVLEKRLLLQGVKRANGALNYVLHGTPSVLDTAASTKLTKLMVTESNEYILKNSKFVGKEFENALIIKLESEGAGVITDVEAKALARNYRSSLEYVVEGSKGNTLTKLQRFRRLNIYDDFMQAGSHTGGWTEKMMKDEIKKSVKIYNKLPATQKNNILLGAKRLSEFYITPKTVKSAPFQLWAIDTVGQLDITESFLDEDNAEAISAFTSCGAMLGASTGTLACAFVTSVGVMAAYIDNDNEKYNPVGINAIGYKTNYYDVQTEYLENIINYYYIALKRDDHQRETRFFLASPCKTEKVVVKHEIIECYVKECKNDVVCCNKTIAYDPYSSNGNGIEKELMWLPKDSCFGYPENYNALLAPSSSSTQNAYLFENKNGQNEVLYTDITLNTNNEIELKNQIVIGTFDSTGWSIDTGIGDEIVSDSECMTTPPAIGNCQGAFYETEPENYFTKEYYPLNYPYITTIDQYEGTGIEYKPGDNQEWFNTVEIKSSENYYKHNPSDFEISEEDYYIQFANAMEHNDEIQNSGSSSVFVPKLYMDSYGTGIKQCETNPKHIMTLWKTKTKTNIDALTVDVEFDYSFEGNNYCYAGKDLLASTLKGGAMLVTVGVAIVADIVLAGTGVGAMAIPAVNFITGAAYEGIVYIVDKSNAWPHR